MLCLFFLEHRALFPKSFFLESDEPSEAVIKKDCKMFPDS